MRRGRLAVLLLALGCAPGEGEERIPEGRYRYVASHPAPSGNVRLEGVLVITESNEDSIAGVWQVPQLHPELDLGGREGAAYEAMAHPTYFGILTHRLRPEGDGIHCEGEYTWMADGGIERTVPVTCSVSPEAGVRPEMPPTGPEDPTIRPIDADTAPPAGAS